MRKIKDKKINPHEKFVQDIWILYTVNKKFYKDVNDFRKNLVIITLNMINHRPINTENFKPGIESEEGKVIAETAHKLDEKNSLGISKIRMKYNLSPSYQSYLEDFVFSDDETKYYYSKESMPDNIRPFLIKNPGNLSENMAVININKNTSIDEIKTFWKEIKKYSAYLLKNDVSVKNKKHSSKNFERDIEIYQQKNLYKKSSEIVKYINNKYSTALSYQEINIIIKRMKNKAQKIITK